MKHIIHITKQHFEWHRTIFLITIALLGISSLVIFNVKISADLKIAFLYIFAVGALIFYKVTSLQPALGQVSNDFSWKFFLGIPVTKREILLATGTCSLFAGIPFIITAIIFCNVINLEYHTNLNAFKVSLNLSIFIFFHALYSIKCLIEFPRNEELRKNPFRSFVRYFRFTLFVIFSIMLTALAISFLDSYFHLDLAKFLLKLFEIAPNYIFSWWATVIYVLVTIHQYFEVLDLWTDEKRTYNKQQWKPKKEFATLAISAIGSAVMVMTVDHSTPPLFKGKIQSAVYKKQYDSLEKATASDLNTPNYYGVTAMMVAVDSGDLKMIQFLEKKGATYEGQIVNSTKNKGKDVVLLAIINRDVSILKYVSSKIENLTRKNTELGYYPIHYAAFTCQSDMVDFLIEQKADVNVLNKEGETPLMVAARRNCLSVAISLKEAGAKFEAKDNLGKLAVDKIAEPKTNKELVYFFQKNTRMPASE